MPILDINSAQLVTYTNKLEQIGRNDLPIAVRGALNKTALHAKQKTLPAVFSREFITRRPTFLKSHAGAKLENFSNLNIATMSSGVGIVENKSRAGDNLEKQEEGGRFNDRAVPMDATRAQFSRQNRQMGNYYYRKFEKRQNGIIERNARRTIVKMKFGIYEIAASGGAKKSRPGWNRMPTKKAARRNNDKRGICNRPIWTTLYKVGLSFAIKKRHFVLKAGEEAAIGMNRFFEAEFNKRMRKIKL